MAFVKEKISKEMFNFYNQFKFTTDGFEKPLVATDGDDWWVNKERELFFINAGQMKECYKKYYLIKSGFSIAVYIDCIHQYESPIKLPPKYRCEVKRIFVPNECKIDIIEIMDDIKDAITSIYTRVKLYSDECEVIYK